MITEADRAEARKWLNFVVGKKLAARNAPPVANVSSEQERGLCAARKQGLMDYIASAGGDAERCSKDITVTVSQRKGGNTAGGFDFYYFDSSGKRYRSNKEVATKLYALDTTNVKSSAKKKRTSVLLESAPKKQKTIAPARKTATPPPLKTPLPAEPMKAPAATPEAVSA